MRCGSIVTNSDHDLLVGIEIEVSASYSMSPLKFFIDNVAKHEPYAAFWVIGIDNDFVAMPWFNGCNITASTGQVT